MKHVLYLSHATPEVYAIIRGAVPAGYQLLTLELWHEAFIDRGRS